MCLSRTWTTTGWTVQCQLMQNFCEILGYLVSETMVNSTSGDLYSLPTPYFLVGRDDWGYLINECNYLKGRCQKGGAKLFPGRKSPNGRTKGNSHKAKHRKFPLNMKIFSLLWWQWNSGTGCSERLWNLLLCRNSEPGQNPVQSCPGEPAFPGC